MADSEFLQHESCPECGSQDNLARYDDGHGHCFGCGHFEPQDGSTVPQKRKPKVEGLIQKGDHRRLGKRKIDVETCKKFDYSVSEFAGKTVQVANYHDPEGGGVVAQKLRFPDKSFIWRGDSDAAGLYGQHLFRSGGKKLVITEGEIDCLSMSQLQDNKWPVVSLPNGAGKQTANDISAQLDWIESFDEVVLMFDMDDAGQSAAREVASMLSGTTAKIAQLPAGDPNDCLVAGLYRETITAMWEAKTYRPDSLVTASDVLEDALKPVEWGLPYPWSALTDMSYGRRWGECVGLGAGTGVGKTEAIMEMLEHDIYTLGQPVGLFAFEQNASETLQRVGGKHARKYFHVPDGDWEDEERRYVLSDLAERDLLFMYKANNVINWDTVKARVRFLALHHGVRLFYLDHLTALVAGAENETKELERIMAELAMLVESLDIWMLYVSHLATPKDGPPHEEGGRVMIRHFKGSRAIGFWSHQMFGLERNQQADTDIGKRTTVLRGLKDRYSGKAVGQTMGLMLNPQTNHLEPVSLEDEPEPDDSGFKDETEPEPEPDPNRDF